MRIFSKNILDQLNYNYLYKREKNIEPDYTDISFADIISEFSRIELGKHKLYKHQYEGFKALREGKNLILRSGTGSGKTEVWVLHSLVEYKNNRQYYVLALYPTLALANDQIKRINKYFSLLGINPLQIDSVKRTEYRAKYGPRKLRELINSSKIIISNPAFILHDIKKLILNPSRALLYNMYKNLNLLIIDEIDFYGPRSLSLLLAMIKFLSEICDNNFQVVVLTATLSNPEDLGSYLRDITGREYVVVNGKPFNVENHLYIVLGKNLRKIWERLREDKTSILEKTGDKTVRDEIEKALESFEYFTKNLYKVISILSSINYNLPSITTDIYEIISKYFEDDYVTLVFTNTISLAEEIVRNIKYRYGNDKPIASHHHLIPKKKREEIEEKARKGEIKIIVSPKTLSQGIDIGTVARIVHIGLPSDVREYFQREGRKGRRREIVFSETIIIPFSRWDRELLSRGFDVFEKWLNMGLEKTLVNPDNYYIYLFTGIAKLKSPWYEAELSDKERLVLEKVGVLTTKGINEKLLNWIYERMNFYEFAPPYGIKRYIVRNDKIYALEPIGHCDLVEKFQPGNIDYSEEALVTHLDTGRSTRYVKAVYEKPITDINFFTDDALSVAYEEYRSIKMEWNEKPNIIRDILSGKLSSEELCVVYVPHNGFGRYRKIPERCIWKLRSEKPRIHVSKNGVIIYYDRRQIYVPKPTAGEYRDFTYGYRYCVDPGEKSDLLRLALAFLMIVLRRVYGIAFETIMYDVIKIGEYKYFSLHEPEAAGIIDKINWIDVRRSIENYVFDELDLILLSEIDEIAYSTLISYDFDWELVRKYALRVIDYILSRDKVRLTIKGIEHIIPKPSPALKKLSLSIMVEVLGEETEAPRLLVSLAIFDGDKTSTATAIYPPIPYIKPPQNIADLEKQVLDKIVYEDYKLIIDNTDAVISQLRIANLRHLSMLISKDTSIIHEISSLSRNKKLENIDLEKLLEQIDIEYERIDPAYIREILDKIGNKYKLYNRTRELIEKYMIMQSKKNYLLYLILSSIK